MAQTKPDEAHRPVERFGRLYCEHSDCSFHCDTSAEFTTHIEEGIALSPDDTAGSRFTWDHRNHTFTTEQ